MRFKASALTGAAALAAAISACAGPPAPIDGAAQQAAVAALLEDWASSGEERRFDDLKALYADEAGFAWIEQGRVAYADHAAITAGVDMAHDMAAEISSEVSNVRVTPLAPDAAAFVADARIALRAEGFGFDFDGVISGVAVKRGERWRFLHGHLSAPQAGDAERPAP